MALPASGQISIGDIYSETGGTPAAGQNHSLWQWEQDVDTEPEWTNKGSTNGSQPTALSEFYDAEYTP